MLLTILQQNLAPAAPWTLFAVIGPAAGWAVPSAAEVKAGQLAGGAAATWAGSTAAPVVSGVFPWPSASTGLSPGVAYNFAIVESNVATDSAVVVGSFTTLSTAAVYYVVYPSALALPSEAQIVAGLNSAGGPAVVHGSTAAPGITSSITIPISGLSPSTSYSAALVWFDGASTYSNIVLLLWATLSDGLEREFRRLQSFIQMEWSSSSPFAMSAAFASPVTTAVSRSSAIDLELP